MLEGLIQMHNQHVVFSSLIGLRQLWEITRLLQSRLHLFSSKTESKSQIRSEAITYRYFLYEMKDTCCPALSGGFMMVLKDIMTGTVLLMQGLMPGVVLTMALNTKDYRLIRAGQNGG
jgi:hypothetical protein